MGALGVAVVLFRVYFRSGTFRQCTHFVRVIEGTGFPHLDAFPLAQTVAYKQYTGRLALWDENFRRADECLSYALGHMHRDYKKNRRLILTALVPVRMALGVLPSESLLARHGLQEVYGPLVRAMRNGDVRTYMGALDTHKAFYIHSGMYLLLEQLTMLVYRTLIRRICRLVIQMTDSYKVRLPWIVNAMKDGAGVEIDLDELECILANLISKKYIKGYISHNPPFLVLAKDGAFRAIREVAMM